MIPLNHKQSLYVNGTSYAWLYFAINVLQRSIYYYTVSSSLACKVSWNVTLTIEGGLKSKLKICLTPPPAI